MADDDLDILQRLLEMADEDEAAAEPTDNSKAAEEHTQGSHFQAENIPPNKRPRVASAKPAVQGAQVSQDCINGDACCRHVATVTAAFRSANTASATASIDDNAKQASASKAGATEKFSGLRVRTSKVLMLFAILQHSTAVTKQPGSRHAHA